jgi:hypothetical protein
MMTTDRIMNRPGTCSVCRVVWEEGSREASPYPDYVRKYIEEVFS